MKKILYSVACAMFFAGCVNENLSDCSPANGGGIVVDGDADIVLGGISGVDGGGVEGSDPVQTVQLYVFDTDTGILKEIITVPKEQVTSGHVDLNLPDGKYTVVAWAGTDTSMGEGGFEGVQGSGGSGAPTAQPGVTTLTDFHEQLKTKPITDGRTGDAEPENSNFSDLYEAIGNITMTNGKTEQTEMNFKKMTAKFQIELTGLDQPGDFDYFIIGHDAVLNSDGTISPTSPAIRYTPNGLRYDGDKATADFKTMRLMLDDPKPMMLYIQYKGTNMIVPIDLSNAVKQAVNAQGEHPYDTQDKVDMIDTFIITLNVTEDADVNVSVGDFQNKPLSPELETAV